MGRPRKQRRNPHGAAWHWKQTDYWYFTLPGAVLIPVVIGTSVLFLAVLGGFGAHDGGAPVLKAAIRVTFWGILAMALTAGMGVLFGASV